MPNLTEAGQSAGPEKQTDRLKSQSTLALGNSISRRISPSANKDSNKTYIMGMLQDWMKHFTIHPNHDKTPHCHSLLSFLRTYTLRKTDVMVSTILITFMAGNMRILRQ